MSGTKRDQGKTPATSDTPPSSPGSREQQMLECLSLGVVAFDRRMRITYHNPAAHLLVAGHDDLVGALQAVTLDSRYQDWQASIRAVLDQHREQRFEQIVFQDPASQEHLLDLLCLPLTHASGEVTGGILVMEEVTARAGLEKRLAVSERMAAVGKLAARVAHELNNPLDGILRYLNLSIRAVQVGQTERLMDYLAHARGGLLRMTEIVRELVEFSRSSFTAFDDTGINTALEEAVKVLSDKAVAAGVTIVCRLDQDMPAMRGTNLFQVFCNLVKNAIDAMPSGGTLTIVTQVVGRHAVIRFEDTGVGLPPEMDRLFEPFFTTKPPGKGTGLGLAICRDIIEKYNGQITPERRPEGGAVFTIQIPLESCARVRRPLDIETGRDPAPSPEQST